MAGQRWTLALYDRDLDAAGSLAAVLPRRYRVELSHLAATFAGCNCSLERRRNCGARCLYEGARTDRRKSYAVTLMTWTYFFDLGLIDAVLGRKARGTERRPARDGTGAHRSKSNVRAVSN